MNGLAVVEALWRHTGITGSIKHAISDFTTVPLSFQFSSWKDAYFTWTQNSRVAVLMQRRTVFFYVSAIYQLWGFFYNAIITIAKCITCFYYAHLQTLRRRNTWNAVHAKMLEYNLRLRSKSRSHGTLWLPPSIICVCTFLFTDYIRTGIQTGPMERLWNHELNQIHYTSQHNPKLLL